MFRTEKKKSRKSGEKGGHSSEDKNKKKIKKIKMSESHRSSDQDGDLADNEAYRVIGTVVNTLCADDEAHASADKYKITSDEEDQAKKKKKKTKRVKKSKIVDSAEKNNLASDLTTEEGIESSLTDPPTVWKDFLEGKEKKKKVRKNKVDDSGDKENLASHLGTEEGTKSSAERKDPVEPEAENKKKRKGGKLDADGKVGPKKPKMKKAKIQPDEGQPPPGSDSVERKHSEAEKHRGKHGSIKPDIPKQKKSAFWSDSAVSLKADSSDHDPVTSSDVVRSKEAKCLGKGSQKPKFAVVPKLSTSNPGSQSSSSNLENPSPEAEEEDAHPVGEGSPKPRKRPKLGVTPEFSSHSSSQSSGSGNLESLQPSTKARMRAGVSAAKKHKAEPAFGVGAPKSREQLAELAQELQELMKQTDEEGASVKSGDPVTKPKKTVPCFSRKGKASEI